MNKDYFVQLNIQDDFDKHIGVVKLNETDSVTLNINLVQNGTPFDLTTANYVTMAIIKPDQSFNNGYCEIVDGPAGKIKYTLPTNCVNQTGVFRGEVQAFNNTSMISTAAFSYEVKNSLLRDEGVTTQPEYPILVELINQVQGAVTAEVGRVSAENGRVSAESSRVTAESSRVSAESTRASNESTRQSQETSRVGAESSRATAETGRVNAESARVSAENTRVSQESTRQSNESSRATAESGRVTAESNRVTAENARVSAESSRASAESTRQSNESTRQTQEANRVSSFATIYQQYLDSISSGSVIEVVNARNGFANLDARLDDSDTKLTANTTEIQNARNGESSLAARLNQIDQKQVDLPPVTLGFTPVSITRTSSAPGSPKLMFTPRHIINPLGKIGGFYKDSNSDGLADGWAGYNTGTFSLSNGEQSFTPTTNAGNISTPISFASVRTVFLCAFTKTTDGTTSIKISTLPITISKANSGSGTYEKIGTIMNSDSTQRSFIIYTNKTSSFVPITVKQAFYCDVTDYPELVGLTNQQKLDWCLANLEYCDGIGVTKNPTVKIQHSDGTTSYTTVQGDFLTGDEISILNGKTLGSKLWSSKKVLYGKDYSYAYVNDYIGRKAVVIPRTELQGIQTSLILGLSVALKYNSSILSEVSPITRGDSFIVSGDGNVYFGLNDSDTGWTETLNPNNDEAKAYMNGWKATANNGTRYTAWVSVVDGTTTPTIQTIDFVKANLAPSYDGYQMYYQFSTAKPIDDNSRDYLAPLVGDEMALLTGVNTVTFDTGVVLDERVTPNISGGYAYINVPGASKLLYPVEIINNVKLNGNIDSAWSYIAGYDSRMGNGVMRCLESAYNPSANYTVDYKILSSIAPQIGSALLTYSEGMVDALNDLREDVQGRQRHHVVHDRAVDLAMYEKRGSRTFTWNEVATGVISITFNVYMSPKLSECPNLSYEVTELYTLVSGVYTDVRSQLTLNSLGWLGNGYYRATFIISNATTVSAIKSSGMYGHIYITADCKGVI